MADGALGKHPLEPAETGAAKQAKVQTLPDVVHATMLPSKMKLWVPDDEAATSKAAARAAVPQPPAGAALSACDACGTAESAWASGVGETAAERQTPLCRECRSWRRFPKPSGAISVDALPRPPPR